MILRKGFAMSRALRTRVAGIFGIAAGWVWGGIPEPDAILYGTANVNGVAARQQDDVLIVARLANGQEVGRYNFADCNADSVNDTCERSCANPGCSGVTACGTARDTNPADGLLDDCPGNQYALKIRNESVPPGLTPAGNAALLNPANPTVARIFIRQADKAERFARNFMISERGKIRNMLLAALDSFTYAIFRDCLRGPGAPPPGGSCTAEEFNGADFEEDGDVDLRDFAFVQNNFVQD